jgi:hypothetical protein
MAARAWFTDTGVADAEPGLQLRTPAGLALRLSVRSRSALRDSGQQFRPLRSGSLWTSDCMRVSVNAQAGWGREKR